MHLKRTTGRKNTRNENTRNGSDAYLNLARANKHEALFGLLNTERARCLVTFAKAQPSNSVKGHNLQTCAEDTAFKLCLRQLQGISPIRK